MPRNAFTLDNAAMLLDQRLRQRQAQTASSFRSRYQRIENLFDQLSRYSGSVIVNMLIQCLFIANCGKSYLS